MSKRVLVYCPPNKRTVAIETLCRAVKEAGHEVYFLSFTPKGPLHEALEKMGIQTDAIEFPRKPSWKYFLSHARFLISYCKKRKIDQVWSHLQEANIVAVLAQRFLGKTKVVAFRHHAESAFFAEYGKQFSVQRNKNEIRFDAIINRLAKKIVVPSSGVWYGMEKYEKADMKKVLLAPYIYDFSSYDKPDPDKVKSIRQQHQCKLMMIMVSRFVQSKQHMPVFEVFSKLVEEGKDIRMLVMDDGPLKEDLEKFVDKHGLRDRIIFTGFRSDFINYMAAADLLMHPSLTEASNNVTKELGLMRKTVAVCRDVGDFNDYICEQKNGYLMRRDNLSNEIERVMRHAYENPMELIKMGEQLREDVLQLFSDTPANRKRFLDLLN